MQLFDHDYTVYTLAQYQAHVERGSYFPNEEGPTLWACYVNGELHTTSNVDEPRPAEATHVVSVSF